MDAELPGLEGSPEVITARERANTLKSIPELWTTSCHISDATMDAILHWAESALIAHAEALKREAVRVAAQWCRQGEVGAETASYIAAAIRLIEVS